MTYKSRDHHGLAAMTLTYILLTSLHVTISLDLNSKQNVETKTKTKTIFSPGDVPIASGNSKVVVIPGDVIARSAVLFNVRDVTSWCNTTTHARHLQQSGYHVTPTGEVVTDTEVSLAHDEVGRELVLNFLAGNSADRTCVVSVLLIRRKLQTSVREDLPVSSSVVYLNVRPAVVKIGVSGLPAVLGCSVRETSTRVYVQREMDYETGENQGQFVFLLAGLTATGETKRWLDFGPK